MMYIALIQNIFGWGTQLMFDPNLLSLADVSIDHTSKTQPIKLIPIMAKRS